MAWLIAFCNRLRVCTIGEMHAVDDSSSYDKEAWIL